MGGLGSTRWGGHARCYTVEECLRLGVSDVAEYLINPAPQRLGFYWSHAGKRSAELELTLGARMLDGSPNVVPRRSLSLRYTVALGDERETIAHSTELVARPMHLGGFRWWLRCPCCERGRTALYLPLRAGGRDWECRTCHGLRYLTQRLPVEGRAEVRMRRVSKRILGKRWDDWLDCPPSKPKWMRHPTYGRHVETWEQASAVRAVWLIGRIERFVTAVDRLRAR